MLKQKRYWLLAAVLLGLGCDKVGIVVPGTGATFVVQVVGEQFRVRIYDETEIAQARALLASGDSSNLHGRIARGNGGFNAGWGWHLQPQTVAFVDAAMELCDGRPSYVQDHISYYVDTVKYYCPWGARVVAEVD